MPLFVFLPFLAVKILDCVYESNSILDTRCLAGGLVFFTLVVCIFSIEPLKHYPYVRIAFSDTRQIRTHDGARSWGGYFQQIYKLKHEGIDKAIDAKNISESIVRAVLEKEDTNIVFIGEENVFSRGAAGWCYAQLRLAEYGYRSVVENSHVVRINVKSNELWLANSLKDIPPSAFRKNRKVHIVYSENPYSNTDRPI